MPSFLQSAITWWAVYYADHQMASLAVRYLHLAGLVIGGGTALASDRALLTHARAADAGRRAGAFASLRAAHAVVIPSLALIAVTGALMAAADWPTFEASRLFWIKMAAVAALVVNGGLLWRAERAYAAGGAPGLWRRLIRVSIVSALLWLIILWLGAWLTVAA